MRRHIKHACDSCKRRKAKCDGTPPRCSSCQTLGVECCYSLPRAKRGPKPRASRGPPTPAAADTSETSGNTPEYVSRAQRHQSFPNDTAIRTSIGSSNSIVETSSPWTPVGPAPATPSVTGSAWPGTPRSFHRGDSPQEVHEYLTSTCEARGVDLESLVQRCILTWTDRAFPLLQCFHPETVMQSIPLLLPASRHRFTLTSTVSSSRETELRSATLEDVRSYCLITALCAQVYCSQMEDPQLREHQAMANVFFTCSRGMLLIFEDMDVSQPGFYSPLIRLAHSSAMHWLGRNRMSRFLVGQALRLSVDMRMFDEKSVDGLEPQQAQLWRNLFWVLYTSDKSLSMLNNLPPTLYDRLEDPAQLELDHDGSPVRLLDGLAGAQHQPCYESQLRHGFDLSNKQWLLAGDMVRDLDLLHRLAKGSASDNDGLSALKKDVTSSYTTFCSLLDSTPLWLSDPESHSADDQDEEATKAQRRGFWSQHANLVVTYHCLKLILIVKAFKLGFAALLGLADDEDLLALRNTEVACELVNDAAKVPLQAFRANGEAMVEKLRQVGVILLEISHRVSSEAIANRAKGLFGRLLDIIATLDSKSSDNLGEEAP